MSTITPTRDEILEFQSTARPFANYGDQVAEWQEGLEASRAEEEEELSNKYRDELYQWIKGRMSDASSYWNEQYDYQGARIDRQFDEAEESIGDFHAATGNVATTINQTTKLASARAEELRGLGLQIQGAQRQEEGAAAGMLQQLFGQQANIEGAEKDRALQLQMLQMQLAAQREQIKAQQEAQQFGWGDIIGGVVGIAAGSFLGPFGATVGAGLASSLTSNWFED